MKAEDEVGLDGFIDQGGAGPDLGSAVEELFGPGEDLCCRGPRHETGGVFLQVPGAQFGDWFAGRPDEGHGGSQGLKSWGEQSGGPQGHVSFGDRGGVVDLIPALLHAGPLAPDVTGVDGDAHSVEGSAGGFGRDFSRRSPVARRCLAGLSEGKGDCRTGSGQLRGHHDGVLSDLEVQILSEEIDVPQGSFEFRPGEDAIILGEFGPLGRGPEVGEARIRGGEFRGGIDPREPGEERVEDPDEEDYSNKVEGRCFPQAAGHRDPLNPVVVRQGPD